MLYREMPKNKDKLSALGFGCMRLPGSQMRPDEAASIELIRYTIDNGVNYFDTAWPYHGGRSEVVLGKALKDGYREKVKIADKLPHWLCSSRDDMDYYLSKQLERLDDTVIDYYLLHSLDGASWEKAKEHGVVDFMENARKNGKIINIGFSFHGSPGDFIKIIDDYKWDFCQIQFNILDEQHQAGIRGLNYAHSKGIGVIIMEPLRGGSLAGKLPHDVENIYRKANNSWSNVEWALRWVWNHPGVITVLSGMNTREQFEENCRIASHANAGSLSEQELETVSGAAATFRKLMKVPCTGCQYCMPCPKDVNIPSAFHFYNNKYLFKQGMMSRMLYLVQHGRLEDNKTSLASQCIACGKCVKHCPQHIAIPQELKKVQKEFEGWTTGIMVFLARMMMSQGKRKRS